LVQLLNSTTANYTVFVPTDLAFKRRPKHAQNLSKKALKDLILYHISPGLYPAIRLVFGHTAPTLLEPKSLGGHPQRVLARWFGFRRGLKVNFYSTVLAANIVGRFFKPFHQTDGNRELKMASFTGPMLSFSLPRLHCSS